MPMLLFEFLLLPMHVYLYLNFHLLSKTLPSYSSVAVRAVVGVAVGLVPPKASAAVCVPQPPN
jgi:hypothetical protein